MKKFIVLTAALVLVSSSAFAALSLSAHDFSASGWTTQICAPCHTPHNAGSGAGPLWSHVSANGASFTMYNSTFSATMDMTVAAAPQGISLACLSCHDGATDMSDFIGGPASGNPMGANPNPFGNTNLGTDLTNDHPISITYDDTLDAASGFHTLAQAKLNGPALVFYGAAQDQVECATCHDVHNGTAAAANGSMLRESIAASGICLDCHNK